MDVQADEAGLRPDPSRHGHRRSDGHRGAGTALPVTLTRPTPTPTESRPSPPGASSHRPGPARWLRVLVVLVALAVLAAGAALGLVKAGIIDKKSPGTPGATQTTQPPTTATPKAPLATPVSTGAGTATYQIGIAAYSVTVVTTTGRSWVEYRRRRTAPNLRGHPPPRQLAEGDPPRELTGRCRRGRNQGDSDFGKPDPHAHAHLGTVQLFVHRQELTWPTGDRVILRFAGYSSRRDPQPCRRGGHGQARHRHLRREVPGADGRHGTERRRGRDDGLR